MTTCAWLEEQVCLIKTLLDQEEFVYCEYRSCMCDCPRYKAYVRELDIY